MRCMVSAQALSSGSGTGISGYPDLEGDSDLYHWKSDTDTFYPAFDQADLCVAARDKIVPAVGREAGSKSDE